MRPTSGLSTGGRLLVSLVVAIAVVFAVVAFLNLRGDRGAENGAGSAAGASGAALVERGRYLALAGNCAGCHTGRGGEAYAGGEGVVTPFGVIYPGNLTPDPEHGLGKWTSADFWRAMHNGRSRSGKLLYPAFPYTSYTRATREDSDAIFAWLRTLPPVARENRPHELRFPYNTQAALAVWRALFFSPGVYEPDRDKTETWNRGAYLVQGLGHCEGCHTPRNALGGTSGEQLEGGLMPMQDWYAPSLTSADEAGLADWPTQEVVHLLGTGVAPQGSVIGPMAEVVYASTQHLSKPDLEAMAAYLQSLPQSAPRRNSDDSSRGSAAARASAASAGKRIYDEHCADCHGEDGRGRRADGQRAYPALAGNRAVTMDSPANLIQMVLAGGYLPATAGNPRPWGMPPFRHVLSDSEIAAVLSYTRGAWSNAAAPVSALEVRNYRERGRR